MMLGIESSAYLASGPASVRHPSVHTPLEKRRLPPQLTLDHFAVAVPSLDEALPSWSRLLGVSPTTVEDIPAQGVRVSFLGALELLEPTSPDTPVGRFLRERGPGLHHVAYRTDDLAAELERLKAAGFQLVDEVPRAGARGHRVAFLHPRGTGGVLVELVEHSR
jgi:methylmalonyl-CoA/ethylmalonyl-CoA epimerase